MTGSLSVQLCIATAMAALTAICHLIGLSLLIALTNRASAMNKHFLNQLLVLVVVAFGLFGLHTVEIWSYAILYDALGATKTFEEALYFSTVTYATIGYGDFTLPRTWRILGAIEGADGIMLLGWSTAFFVSVVAAFGPWSTIGCSMAKRLRRIHQRA